jgi:hypothetical protein
VRVHRIANPIFTPNHPILRPADTASKLRTFFPSAGSPTIRPSGPINTTPRAEAKPIKDRPSSCGLAHRAVYSISRRRYPSALEVHCAAKPSKPLSVIFIDDTVFNFIFTCEICHLACDLTSSLHTAVYS